MDTNTTFTGSWDKKTGSQVHDIIVNQVQGIVDTLNTAVSGVSVTKDENQSDAFNVTVNYFDKDPVVTHIELTPQSAMSAVLLSLTPETEYLVPGNALDVFYTWQVRDEDGSTLISGKIGKITLFVNGIAVATVNTVKSASNLNRQGSIAVDGRFFKVGVNNITAAIELNDSGKQAQFIDESETVNVVSFNLTLKSSFGNATTSYNTLFESNSKFSLNFEYLDDNNKNLLTDSEYKNFKFASNDSLASLLHTNYIAQAGNVTTNGSWSGSTSGEITYSSLFTSYSSGSARLYLQGCFTYGGNSFYSNGVKYGLVNRSDSTSNRYAYYIPNYTNYKSTGEISEPTNILSVTQYQEITFDISIYAYTNTSVSFILNDNQISEPVQISANQNVLQPLKWNYVFSIGGDNTLTIGDVTYRVNVNALSNEVVIPNDYILSFDAYGKQGETTEATYGDYKINLTGFDFGSNGWLNNALVVNNNAQAVLNCKACQNKNNLVEKSVSIKFKTSNENTNECLISCHSFGCDGFEIYPQKAILYKGNTSVSTEFSSEDSIKEVTFVWYGPSYGNIGIIYVNGTSQIVNTNSSSVSNDTNIVINANQTTLYLYNIEVYNRALTFFEVQSISAIHNKKDLSEYIEQNNIFDGTISNGNDSSGRGNQEKVTIDQLPIGSTYMLIKAFRNPDNVNDVGESKFWEKINNLTDKGIKIIAGNTYLITKTDDTSVGHPSNFFADRIAFYGQGTSSMFYPIKNYRIAFKKDWKEKDMSKEQSYSGYDSSDLSKMRTKIFITGTEVTGPNYINTTSSESKKYKLYSRDRGDSYDSIPANIFCLKADYAESSGVHNTGFARMANYALESSANIFGETPTSGIDTRIEKHSNIPQNYFDNDNKYRSCIDGRPIYLFFEDLDGNQYYGGKYNLNNEKSSEDVFGFTGSSAYFAKNNGSEVFDQNNSNYPMSENKMFSGIENEAEHLKQLFGLTQSQSEDYDATHDPIKSGDNVLYVNPTECWEFSTNNPTELSNYDKLKNELGWPYVNIAAFTYPYTVGDAKNNSEYPFGTNSAYQNYDPFSIKTTNNALAWLDSEQAWEYRYPDETGEDVYFAGARPLLLESLYKFLHKNNVYLWSSTIDKMSHANTFAVNLHKYFNVNYLLKYYMMTKWFINADQRIKNCMLSFYYDPYAEDNTDSESPMGHMRAYYLFYDNDTILGVGNSGALTNPWNTDEEYNRYQGIDENGVSFHGIWGNLEYCYNLYITNQYGEYTAIAQLGQLMEAAYQSIRNVISDSKLVEYLGNHYPDSSSNIDAEVKYFYPNKLSSFVHPSSSATEFNSTNIAKYQGTREFHRELILSKRTKWFDARFGGTSIKDYALTFKSSGTIDRFPQGKITITSYFDKWRFYWIPGEGSTRSTSIVNKNQSATISVTEVVNSFVSTLCGLYGAKSIDLSRMSGNNTPLQDFGFSKKLPYLQEFILGNSDNATKVVDSLSSQLFEDDKVANLTKLSLIKLQPYNINQSTQSNTDDDFASSSSFADLNIQNLTRLEYLNLSNTLIDVNLSNSPLLQTLYLYKPTKLSLVNKYNLNTFSIDSVDSLKTITVDHCNSLIYTWSLDTILNKLTTIASSSYTVETPNQLTANIIIGHGSQVDALLDSEIILIARIASVLKDNPSLPVQVSISGLGQNSNINTLTYNGNSCIDLISRIFKDLVIQTESTSEFILTPVGDTYTFVEGESLQIRSSRPVTQWNMTIDGVVTESDENSIHSDDGNIVLDLQDASQYTCIITANKEYNNVQRSYRITISATDAENHPVDCDPIVAAYVPINQIILTPDTNITESLATIAVNINNNSTKKFLLNADYIDNQVIGQPKITYEAAKGTISVNTDSDNIIQSLGYTINASLDSDNKDGDVTLTFNSISGTTTIYYDKIIINNKNDIRDTPSLKWLYYILTNGFGNLPNVIRRHVLTEYTLTNDTFKSFSNLDANNNPVVQDLTNMQYLTLGTTSYTMPSFAFSNAVLPEGLQYLTWKSIDEANVNNYLKLILPKSLVRAMIKPSATNNPLANLEIDLNKNTHLTRILNTGTDDVTRIQDGTIDIAFTFAQVPNEPHVLFTNYPSSIEQIGSYFDTVNYTNESNTPASIFNYNNDSSNGVVAFYTFGAPVVTKLKIGKIANYKVSTALFDWNAISNNIIGLYYTFNAGTNTSGNIEYTGFSGLGTTKELNLPNVTFIGDKTFYNCNETDVTININPTKITSVGYAAFSEFGGSLGSTNGSGTDFNFTSLLGIGVSGFNHLDGYTFRLPAIITISDYAFNLDQISTVTANKIYIPNATLTNYTSLSFGNSTTYKNDVYVGDTALYNKMQSDGLSQYANLINE